MTFDEAVSHFDNCKYRLAKALGVSRQAVQHWYTNKDKPIPALRAYQIRDILSARNGGQINDA